MTLAYLKEHLKVNCKRYNLEYFESKEYKESWERSILADEKRRKEINGMYSHWQRQAVRTEERRRGGSR
jgi:O-glycosyl hydrolase